MDRADRKDSQGLKLCKLSDWLLMGLLLPLVAVGEAHGQFSDTVPSMPYFVAVGDLYAGEYRDAERALGREARRGVNTLQGRWIDSICYHAMLGEVLYQQGRNADALAEFDQACQLWMAYPNWILRLRQEPLRPSANVGRRPPPWGQSQRRSVFGDAPGIMQIAMGRMDNSDVLQRGGVVVQAQYWRVNAGEIVRTAALAIRRRNELLGPLASHDPISRELVEVLSRGNITPANHWTGAWIDLLRGLAQVGVGRLDEAEALFDRATIADGQFDHALTCVALLEQGRLAMLRGDNRRAAGLLAEAGYSAYYYENWDALTESVWLGWLNHVATGGAGPYPPLEPVALWAQGNRLQHVVAKLRTAQAESLVWLRQIPQATPILADVNRRLGEMRTSLSAIHQLYVQAALQVGEGQIAQGGELLNQALAAQAGASVRNYQIARAGLMYDRGALAHRLAVDVFARLLADPTPSDWAYTPLDAMAVLGTNHDAAFDRWFQAALARKDLRLALEITEAAKRRRFLSSLPLGGRLAALRTILEAPVGELSPDSVLQRQQLLATAPNYRDLSAGGEKLYADLRASTILAKGNAEARPLANRFDQWNENAEQRELLLMQMALRRVATSIDFPPLRSAADLEGRLAKGEALVVFHAAGGDLYGIVVDGADVRTWQIGDVRRVRTAIGELLRDLGNYNANRSLTLADLQSDRWRDTAAKLHELILAEARLDPAATKALVIVPDDLLWYLPFEALVLANAAGGKVLADRTTVRYGPTAALAIGDARPFRPAQHTGIVANQFAKDDAAAGGAEAVKELEQLVVGPVRLPTPLPEPGHLLSTLLDQLIVLDELEPGRDGGYGWSPLEQSKGAAGDSLAKWFALPYGGPERVVMTGFPTLAEQGLAGSRRASARGKGSNGDRRPGSEIFQPVCALMANGARTILLTRWRTGGRTNFDLVREFVLELPNTSATDAWQRACVLAREMPLDPAREPRLKLADESAEAPKADHPFFWAGYLLVDSAHRLVDDPADEDDAMVQAEKKPPEAPKDATAKMPLPPPAQRGNLPDMNAAAKDESGAAPLPPEDDAGVPASSAPDK